MRTCFYQYHMPNGILTESILDAKSRSDVTLVVIAKPALTPKSRRDVTPELVNVLVQISEFALTIRRPLAGL